MRISQTHSVFTYPNKRISAQSISRGMVPAPSSTAIPAVAGFPAIHDPRRTWLHLHLGRQRWMILQMRKGGSRLLRRYWVPRCRRRRRTVLTWRERKGGERVTDHKLCAVNQCVPRSRKDSEWMVIVAPRMYCTCSSKNPLQAGRPIEEYRCVSQRGTMTLDEDSYVPPQSFTI